MCFDGFDTKNNGDNENQSPSPLICVLMPRVVIMIQSRFYDLTMNWMAILIIYIAIRNRRKEHQCAISHRRSVLMRFLSHRLNNLSSAASRNYAYCRSFDFIWRNAFSNYRVRHTHLFIIDNYFRTRWSCISSSVSYLLDNASIFMSAGIARQ